MHKKRWSVDWVFFFMWLNPILSTAERIANLWKSRCTGAYRTQSTIVLRLIASLMYIFLIRILTIIVWKLAWQVLQIQWKLAIKNSRYVTIYLILISAMLLKKVWIFFLQYNHTKCFCSHIPLQTFCFKKMFFSLNAATLSKKCTYFGTVQNTPSWGFTSVIISLLWQSLLLDHVLLNTNTTILNLSCHKPYLMRGVFVSTGATTATTTPSLAASATVWMRI